MRTGDTLMDYSRYQALSCEQQDKVLIVSLNRPEALNAINADLHTELSHIFADIALDQETHAVVLTGRGRASFQARLAFTMAAFNVLVQWHGLQPNMYGFVPLSIAELSL